MSPSRTALSSFWLSLLIVLSSTANADGSSASFVADSHAIYRVKPNGQRVAIAQAKSSELFVESTLQVSPNGSWALIDYVPAKAGPGRIQEVKILISLSSNERVDSDQFQKKYGVWLAELAEWDPKAPATIVMDDGKRIQLR